MCTPVLVIDAGRSTMVDLPVGGTKTNTPAVYQQWYTVLRVGLHVHKITYYVKNLSV